MLKPVDPRPGAAPERSIGELVHQLVEDGKAYAQAEVALVKATATARATALSVPAALLAGALLCVIAALSALALGVVLALAKFIGPLLAGLAGLLIFVGLAAVLALVAKSRIKEATNGR